MTADPRGRQVARIAGTPIRLTAGSAMLAAWLTWVYGEVLAIRYPQLGLAQWPTAVLFAVVFLVSIGLHEAGHVVAGRHCGLRVRWVVLDALGGETEFEQDAATPGVSAAVAAAGPAVSVALTAVLELLARASPHGTVIGFFLAQAALGNGILAVFNLLPGLPLDGGCLLRDGLWKLTGKQRTATIVSAGTGLALAVAIVVAPIWLLLGAGSRPGLVGVAILLFVAVPIATGSWSILREQWPRSRQDESRQQTHQEPGAPSDAIVLHAAQPVREALQRCASSGAGAVLVADAIGAVMGVVTRDDLLRVPPKDRDFMPLGALLGPARTS